MDAAGSVDRHTTTSSLELNMPHWTPGPIETREADEMIAIAQVGFMPHASVFNRGGGPVTEETRSNARVLSAALDLFEALEAAAICVELQTPQGARGTLPEWARHEGGDPLYEVVAERARAAMARATGA